MSNYELTYVLRPGDETTLTTVQDRIAAQLQNAGGEIAARHDWGRRRLAYPIRKINDGYYTTLYVTLPGPAVRGIERQLRLNDDVLRYLFVRVEEFVVPQAAAPAPEPRAEAEPAAAPTVEASAETPADTETSGAETTPAETTPVAQAAAAPTEGS